MNEYPTDKLKQFYSIEDNNKLVFRQITRGGRVKKHNVMTLEYYFSKVVTVPDGTGNERIFIIGGSKDDEGTDCVTDCFELVEAGKNKFELEAITPLPSPVISPAAAVRENGNEFYLAGGTEAENKKPISNCWAYNIEKEEWMALPDLNMPRFSATLACNDGELYIIGG